MEQSILGKGVLGSGNLRIPGGHSVPAGWQGLQFRRQSWRGVVRMGLGREPGQLDRSLENHTKEFASDGVTEQSCGLWLGKVSRTNRVMSWWGLGGGLGGKEAI